MILNLIDFKRKSQFNKVEKKKPQRGEEGEAGGRAAESILLHSSSKLTMARGLRFLPIISHLTFALRQAV